MKLLIIGGRDHLGGGDGAGGSPGRPPAGLLLLPQPPPSLPLPLPAGHSFLRQLAS